MRRPVAWRRAAVAWLTVFALVLHLEALGAMAPHLAAIPRAAAAVPDAVGPVVAGCHDTSGAPGGGPGGVGHDCPVCQSLQSGLSLALPQAAPDCLRPEAASQPLPRPADERPPLTAAVGGGPRAPPSSS